MKLRVLIAFLATGAACAAFGGVVTNDYSWVRGTHYRLNGDAAKTARELGYGRRVGLNAVRFWTPGIGTWKKNPATPLSSLGARGTPITLSKKRHRKVETKS